MSNSSDLKNRATDLQAKLAKAQASLNNLNAPTENTTDVQVAINNRHENAAVELQDYQDQIVSLKNELRRAEERHERSEAAAKNRGFAGEELEEVKRQLQSTDDQLKFKTTRMAQLEADVGGMQKTYQDRVSRAEEDREKARGEASALKSEIRLMQTKSDNQLRQKEDELDRERDQMLADLEEKYQLEARRNLRSNDAATIDKLRSSEKQIGLERDNLRRDLRDTQQLNESVRQELHDSRVDTAEAKVELKRSQEIARGFEMQLKERQRTLDHMREENERLASERAADVAVSNSQVHESFLRLKDAKTSRDRELEKLRSQLQGERTKLVSEIEMRHNAEARSIDLGMLFDNMKSEHNVAQRELTLVKDIQTTRSVMFNEVAESAQYLEDMKQRMADLEGLLGASQQDNESMKNEIAVLEQSLRESMRDRESLAKSIQMLQMDRMTVITK